ncbi:MAG: lytic transglycosylase domain-containing protein [Ginsengibacter sp.]
MYKFTAILFSFIFFYPCYSLCQHINNHVDTLVNDKKENKIIEQVVHSTTPVKKEKVEYLSQVTKYGFKNLFKNYTYNPSIPYSLQVNPYAEKYMEDYLQAHTNFLLRLKKTGVPYFNLIDGILSQYGLPHELKYLAVIESDLKSNALSVAGALGPWQFMSYTAKDYGLRVNSQVDDRTDYTKSTHAAAKYLLNLYKDLKDWLLVIAAYNGGPGRVYSAIKKSGSRDFWKLQYYLPEESRNHVKKFIATHYVMEGGNTNPENNSFDYTRLSGNVDDPVLSDSEKTDLTTLELSGRYRASIIAKYIEMKIDDFNKYNPGLDATIANGLSYEMKLPKEKMQLFQLKKYDILNECVQAIFNDIKADTKTVYKKRKF